MKLERNTVSSQQIVINKRYRNILLTCIFLVMFIVIDTAIGEVLYYFKYFHQPDMHSLAWKDFYNQEDNSVDVIFMGSSHGRFAFDTRTFDSELGVKTFNISSSGQTPIVGYYALKEALRYQKPRLVVYETYWRVFGTGNNVTPAFFVYDYVKGWDTRLGILSSIYGEDDYSDFVLQALSRSYKYRSAFIPAVKSAMKGNIIRPVTSGPIKYEYFTYYENGFFGSDGIASKEKLYETNPFKKASPDFKINPKQLEYFQKTLDMCEANSIPVLLVTAPLPVPTMDFMKNYQQFHDEFSRISESYGIEYLDYNLENINTRVFTNDMFYDSNHLNMKGTKFLGELLVPRVKRYLASND